VDTNCDPDLVDYPIAGNDDAIRSVRMILATVSQVVTRAQAEYETKASRRKPMDESPLSETETAQIAAAPTEAAPVPVETVPPE
jgi:small subunit ribosomal protein S2